MPVQPGPHADDLSHAVEHARVGQQQGIGIGSEEAIFRPHVQHRRCSCVAEGVQLVQALERRPVKHVSLRIHLLDRERPGSVAAVSNVQIEVSPVRLGEEDGRRESGRALAEQRHLDPLDAGFGIAGFDARLDCAAQGWACR